MISDLKLIDLFYSDGNAEYMDGVDDDGNPVVYYPVQRNGILVRVDVDDQWGEGLRRTVWTRPAPDESIARAAKLIASSSYGKTYPHQGDCADSDWNGSH